MFLENCLIIENKLISDRYFLIKIKANEEMVKNCNAGQFFMLQCKNEIFFLRRPISLHYADKKDNILEFYYEVKGNGTLDIASLRQGETINIQGPLGNGFDTDVKDKNIVIIGGGMGIAPMKLLVEKLNSHNKIFFVAGGRNGEVLEILSNFDLDNLTLYLTTDDGSVGEKGNVVDSLKNILVDNKIDLIMTCGPQKMMEAVAKVAFDNNIKCLISLEARMACGIKACVGCSIKTKQGMKKVCYDGPVFDARDIVEYTPDENIGCCQNK